MKRRFINLLVLLLAIVFMFASCKAEPENSAVNDEDGSPPGGISQLSDDDPVKTYELGDTGPAGGMIFYDVDLDNTAEDPDGEDNLLSTVCGWRYLEAAPAEMSLIDGVPSVDRNAEGYDDGERFIYWGYNSSSEEGLTFSNGTDTYHSDNCTNLGLGEGKKNTEILVEWMGESAYYDIFDPLPVNEGKYAALYCDEFVYGGYSDWFMPSQEEMFILFRYYGLNNEASDLPALYNLEYYWTSSEEENYMLDACFISREYCIEPDVTDFDSFRESDSFDSKYCYDSGVIPVRQF